MSQFRTDFGYVTSDGETILPASWQSAFNSVSSIGGMFGGLSLGWISDRLGLVTFAVLVSSFTDASVTDDVALLPLRASFPSSAS